MLGIIYKKGMNNFSGGIIEIFMSFAPIWGKNLRDNQLVVKAYFFSSDFFVRKQDGLDVERRSVKAYLGIAGKHSTSHSGKRPVIEMPKQPDKVKL